jgi:hypothetical protein
MASTRELSAIPRCRPGPSTASVGTESAAAHFFNGDIAEIQVYGRALSDQECAEAKAVLKAKWGLP